MQAIKAFRGIALPVGLLAGLHGTQSGGASCGSSEEEREGAACEKMEL